VEVNLTFVTWWLCPINLLYPLFNKLQGYLNNLTNPKSSPVAKISETGWRSTVLISYPSEYGGQIP